jgi:hypothetical protein
VRTSTALTIGWIASVLAGVAIIGLISITLFYALAQRGDNPFGTLNDMCVALGGIFSGWLAWKLYPTHHSYAPRESRLALGLGFGGACLVPVGSVLVIFGFTGWFLAALVTTFGYALIGLWLLGLNNSALHWRAFPRALAQYGVITAWVMVIGILAAPGILAGTDALESAPWLVLTALYTGGLGWNILYTIWCVWLARLLFTNM